MVTCGPPSNGGRDRTNTERGRRHQLGRLEPILADGSVPGACFRPSWRSIRAGCHLPSVRAGLTREAGYARSSAAASCLPVLWRAGFGPGARGRSWRIGFRPAGAEVEPPGAVGSDSDLGVPVGLPEVDLDRLAVGFGRDDRPEPGASVRWGVGIGVVVGIVWVRCAEVHGPVGDVLDVRRGRGDPASGAPPRSVGKAAASRRDVVLPAPSRTGCR
jgi:hypothetical protein